MSEVSQSIDLPPVDESEDPPFYRWDWQKWERLTVAVMELEPEIVTANPYGVSGQTQFGVDVIAQRENDANEVASCKLTDEIDAADLIGWSNDFLKHWGSHWRQADVRRFILATTATNTADRKIQDQVLLERQKFKANGVRYELWGPRQFRKKLRPQRPIVVNFLPDPWPNIICGPPANSAPSQTGSSNILAQAAVAQLGDLQRALSGQVAKRADDAIDSLRAGQLKEVRSLIEELREPDMWSQLAPDMHAKLIRLDALVNLRDGALQKAETLAAEARQIEPSHDRRLEAQIALEQSGVDEALKELGDPKSLEGRQLLATLLLMQGRNEQVSEILENLLSNEPDAETWRLTALNRLARGEREMALQAIHQAEALASDWIVVLQAGIIVRYAQSVSPVASSEWLFYPNPLDPALVREDEASQAFLLEAIPLADRMLQVSDRHEAALWKLALLANRRNGQEAASNYARSLLADHPNDLTAIAWCINRALDVDLAPSLASLKVQYEAGATLFATRVLGLLLLNLEPQTAAEFLKAHLGTQAEEPREEAGKWIARIEGVPEVVDDTDLVPGLLRLGREEGHWEEVARAAAERVSADPPKVEGLALTQALAENSQWDLIAPFTSRLKLYETAGAVRLAAFVLFNAGDYDGMLTLLDEEEYLFGPALPDSLRRLRAVALQRTGRLQQSLQELSLVSDPGSTEAQLLTAEVRASIGDVRGSVPIVREALRLGRLGGIEALHWSQALLLEDVDLARELWRAAQQGERRGRLAVALMDQAFRLGLDREIGALMPEVNAYAATGEGPIRLVSLEEVQSLMAQWRAGADEIARQYQDGALPAHLVARNDDAAFLRLFAQRDPAEPRLKPRLIRSGARPGDLRIEDAFGDLVIHLDVSGLIVADQIGLLDHLDHVREPIRIAPELPSVLMLMERGSLATQPSQIEARRTAWASVRDGEVRIAAAIEDEQSTLVLSASANAAASLGAFVRGLKKRGLIGSDEAEKALEEVADPESATAALDGIGTLRLDLHSLVQLAGAGLLTIATQHYRLEIDPDVRDALRVELDLADEGERLARLAKRLRERVADNIATGRFLLLEPSRDEEDASEGEGPLIRSLGAILMAPPVEHGVAWIDDRHVSSYSRTASMPTVGTVEVLETLRAQGLLTDEHHREKLLALRALGACFIPLSADEIVAPLERAAIADGQVVENDDLIALRRSFGAAGCLEGNLDIAKPGVPRSDGRPDEMEYPRATMRLLHGCLDRLWRDVPVDVDRVYALSDWLWFNLRETQLNRPIPSDDPARSRDEFEAMQVSHLLDKAIEIGGTRDERRTLREAYLSWVWQRCVQPKAASDPGFLERIAEHLAGFYRGLLDEYSTREKGLDRRILTALTLLRLDRLPQPIRQRVIATGRFTEHSKVENRVSVGKLRFHPPAFWRAIRETLRYGKARVRTVDGRRVRIAKDGASLKFTGPIRARLTDKMNDLVGAQPAQLPPLIDEYLTLLDVDSSARSDVTAQARGAHLQPHQLANLFTDLRESAPVRRYELLAERLSKQGGVDLELLFPAPARRLAHFAGLDPSRPLNLEHARKVLEQRVGPAEAFRRLSALPVPIPEEFLARFDDDELAELARSSTGYLSHVHLIREARRRRWEAQRIDELVEDLINRMIEIGTMHVQMLRWSERALTKDDAASSLHAEVRAALVWVHAEQLLHRFVRARTAPQSVADYLESTPPVLSAPQLLARIAGLRDAGAADRITWQAILYHGLGHAFGTENLEAVLSEGVFNRLIEILRVVNGEVVSPEYSLVRRSPDQSDILGSFLRKKPAGILDDRLDPGLTRDALIEAALSKLEEKETDQGEAWHQLGAFAQLGVTDDQRARISTLAHSADLFSIAKHGDQFEPIIWRGVLDALVLSEREWVKGALFTLARRSHDQIGPVVDGNEQSEQALDQLVELSAIVAANATSNPLDEFANLLLGLAMNWPDSARKLRRLIDQLIASTPAREADSLWKLHLQLVSMA